MSQPLTPPPPPSPLLPVANIPKTLLGDDDPVEWIVPGFLYHSALITLGGMPGAGKSFFCYSLSIALATGTPFLGWPLAPRRVLYFDQENSIPDSTQYARWAWNGLGQPSIDLLTSNLHLARFALGGREWASRAAAYVVATDPDLIIIDTTTPACAIHDENENAEADGAIQVLRSLQTLRTPAPAILALKHAKIASEDGTMTLRGAKAWLGAVDGVVFQSRPAGRPREDGLRVTKLEPHKTRAFGLRSPITLYPSWLNRGEGRAEGLKLEAFDRPEPG